MCGEHNFRTTAGDNTGQNTKDTHSVPGQKLKFLTTPGIEPGPPGWKAGTLPTTPRRRMLMLQAYTNCNCTITILWARWLKWQGAWLRAGRPGFKPVCRRDGDFSSLLRVQTGPGVHSTSYKRVPGNFPGLKAAHLILLPWL